MVSDAPKHYPVLLNELVSIITPQHGGTFIDCTFGQGGYSKEILSYQKTKVIALDRDIESIKKAEKISQKYPDRFSFKNKKFSNIDDLKLKNENIKAVIIDLGYSTTPSVEVFIGREGLDGGIMISASHNGIEWNALKLFNSKGEFISKDDFDNINYIIDKKSFSYEYIKSAGKIITHSHSIEQHIELILSNELVNINKIKSDK